MKWCQLREAEVYPPLLGNPSIPSLTSSFLLPLLPRCPALSSQYPSPINPPFSSLTLLLRLLKTGVSGIAKTLIFDHLYHHHHHLPLPSICVMAQGLPTCCPDCDCWKSAMLEALRDQWTYNRTVNIHSWACCVSVNTHVYREHTHALCRQRPTVTPWACCRISAPPFPGVWMEESNSG